MNPTHCGTSHSSKVNKIDILSGKTTQLDHLAARVLPWCPQLHVALVLQRRHRNQTRKPWGRTWKDATALSLRCALIVWIWLHNWTIQEREGDRYQCQQGNLEMWGGVAAEKA